MILPKQMPSSLHLDSTDNASSSTTKACVLELILSNSIAVDSALVTSSSKDHEELVLWHERMGHVNIDTIHRISANGSLHDFKLEKHIQLQHPCEGCMLGKQHKSTYTHDPNKQRSIIPGHLIHGDVSGKLTKTPSLGGSTYYVLYKDDATAYRFVHFAK